MAVKLEQRVTALERQVAQLLQGQSNAVAAGRDWVDDLYGKFADDPIFERAMKLGRSYRKSLRPRAGNGKHRR